MTESKIQLVMVTGMTVLVRPSPSNRLNLGYFTIDNMPGALAEIY